jgi:hypothetical protein
VQDRVDSVPREGRAYIGRKAGHRRRAIDARSFDSDAAGQQSPREIAGPVLAGTV